MQPDLPAQEDEEMTGSIASFDDGYYYGSDDVSQDEVRYRIYRVQSDDEAVFGSGMVLKIVRSFYTRGPATDEDLERELASEETGDYVVYPFDACQEFEVTRGESTVKRIVKDGRSV